MSRTKRPLMITDTSQAYFASMPGCGFRKDELRKSLFSSLEIWHNNLDSNLEDFRK